MSPVPTRALCHAILASAAIASVAACGESGPVTVRIFGFDQTTKQYGTFERRLHSLDDVREMRGETVRFVGGATLVADLVAASSDPKGNRTLRAEGGMAPQCSFTERDGVLHPDDYDSLNMASAYWALEVARDMFIDLGVQPSELNALRAYYHPRIEFGTKLVPTFMAMTDNAAYAPPFDGFLIVPHTAIQGVPFTTNLGVMAHEYSHKVTNRLVEKGANVQAWLKHDWSVSAANQIRGIDEGVADIFGFLATGQTDYIAPSVGELAIDLDRDIAETRIMPPEYADEILSNEQSTDLATAYDPHELGAFVAAAWWRFGEDLRDHRRVALALLAAQRDIGDAIAEASAAGRAYDYSTLEFLSRVASKFEGDERTRLCNLYKERFASLIAKDAAHKMEACP